MSIPIDSVEDEQNHNATNVASTDHSNEGWGKATRSIDSSRTLSVRDRIVVIGRRQAGKTVFLTRLYTNCWNGNMNIRMSCNSGPDHAMFMQLYSDLEKGVWPAATNVSRYFTIDVSMRSTTIPMVVLDYPGEVFTKAFSSDLDDDLTRELKEHIDRAAAVFVMVDPGVAMYGDTLEKVDDDYGISKAILRVRESPNGSTVPIAIVMTKCDMHKKNILKIMDKEGMIDKRSSDGLTLFMKKYFRSWFYSLGDERYFRIFPTAAIRTRKDVRGKTIPDMSKRSLEIEKPLIWCFMKVAKQRKSERKSNRLRERSEKLMYFRKTEKETSRKHAIFWASFLIIMVIVLVLIAIGTHQFLKKGAGESESKADASQATSEYSSSTLFGDFSNDSDNPEPAVVEAIGDKVSDGEYVMGCVWSYQEAVPEVVVYA